MRKKVIMVLLCLAIAVMGLTACGTGISHNSQVVQEVICL